MDSNTLTVKPTTTLEVTVSGSNTSAQTVCKIGVERARLRKTMNQKMRMVGRNERRAGPSYQHMIAVVRYTSGFPPSARPLTSCTFTTQFIGMLRADQELKRRKSESLLPTANNSALGPDAVKNKVPVHTKQLYIA